MISWNGYKRSLFVLKIKTLLKLSLTYKTFIGLLNVYMPSCVQLFVTPWTAAFQAPPSMGFSRQEYWSGVPSPASVHSKCQFVVDRGNNASE